MNEKTEAAHDADNIQDDAIGRLIAQAGPAHSASPAEQDAIRQIVHDEWKQMVARRRGSRMNWLALAATIVVSAGALLGWQIVSRSPHRDMVEVATLPQSAPGIVVRRSDAPVATHRDEVSLFSGDELQTTAQGVRITLKNGIALRIAPHSKLHMNGLDTLTLLAGALYFEGAEHDEPLTVNTLFGSVTHVGTRYLVEITDSALIVRVRDGEVRVTAGDRRISVPTHEQLNLGADGHAIRSVIPGSGESWDWVDALTPPMEIENQHLDEFLSWAAHETGRQLSFADEAVRTEAHNTILHGSVANLSPHQALATVLMTTDFDRALESDRLLIRRKNR